jgi:hypothetical protein
VTQIKAAIRKLAQVDDPITKAVVLSIDKNAYTCNVQVVNNEVELQNVKIKPIINSGDATQLGLVLFPAVNSFVTIAQVNGDNNDMVVINMTTIDSISLDTATAIKLILDTSGNLSLNAVKMVLNNGNNGGIPLVNPLAQAIAQLQTQVNQLIATFNTHIHPVAGEATAPTVTPGPAPTAPVMQATDIANPVITQ